jgi:hypothetical protein
MSAFCSQTCEHFVHSGRHLDDAAHGRDAVGCFPHITDYHSDAREIPLAILNLGGIGIVACGASAHCDAAVRHALQRSRIGRPLAMSQPY